MRARQSSIPLTFRFALFTASLLVLLTICLTMFVSGSLERSARRELESRTLAMAHLTTQSVLPWLEANDSRSAQTFLAKLSEQTGGFALLYRTDGSLLAATRKYDEQRKLYMTVLAKMNSESLKPVAWLPTYGDTSYAGLLWHKGMLWVSYYSSHEGRSSIYLAKVRWPLQR